MGGELAGFKVVPNNCIACCSRYTALVGVVCEGFGVLIALVGVVSEGFGVSDSLSGVVCKGLGVSEIGCTQQVLGLHPRLQRERQSTCWAPR